ncbi:MAG TPA: hypothetical protein PLQ97_08165 [Myxococcota bacterium]|nr:hypothetical protein [Myxococcota bacterium]HQK50861.1 hypothetical protein [Myxococcota bacterium]
MKGTGWLAVVLVSGACGAAAGFLAGRWAASHGPIPAADVAPAAREAAPLTAAVPGPRAPEAPSVSPPAPVGEPASGTEVGAPPPPAGDGPPPPEGLVRQEPTIVKIPEPWEVGPATGPAGGPGAPAPNP